MSIALYRLDDRLIHGQVVVGWGQSLDVSRIVLVDDEVQASDWEQDLYRMGVPSHIDVVFASVVDAAGRLAGWEGDPRVTIVLVGDIDTAVQLVEQSGRVTSLNVGGIHHRAGRTERLRYVYLTPEEAAQLRRLGAAGVEVTAQDVPTARAIPLGEFT